MYGMIVGYLCAPLGVLLPERERDIRAALEISEFLWRSGIAHMSIHAIARALPSLPSQDLFFGGGELLQRCSVVFACAGWSASERCAGEVRLAERVGLEIFDCEVSNLSLMVQDLRNRYTQISNSGHFTRTVDPDPTGRFTDERISTSKDDMTICQRWVDHAWETTRVDQLTSWSRSSVRCAHCYGAIRIHKQRVPHGPQDHAEHLFVQDSAHCKAGHHFTGSHKESSAPVRPPADVPKP